MSDCCQPCVKTFIMSICCSKCNTYQCYNYPTCNKQWMVHITYCSYNLKDHGRGIQSSLSVLCSSDQMQCKITPCCLAIEAITLLWSRMLGFQSTQTLCSIIKQKNVQFVCQVIAKQNHCIYFWIRTILFLFIISHYGIWWWKRCGIRFYSEETHPHTGSG